MYGSSGTSEKEAGLGSHSVNLSGLLHFLHVECSTDSHNDLYFESYEIGLIYFTYENHIFLLWQKIKASERQGRNQCRQGHLFLFM